MPNRALTIALAMLCVPVAAAVIWCAVVWLTWAMQARIAGLVSGLVVAAVIIGAGTWWETRA